MLADIQAAATQTVTVQDRGTGTRPAIIDDPNLSPYPCKPATMPKPATRYFA